MLRTHTDHQAQRLEIRSRELHRVAAGGKILQNEIAVSIGLDRKAQRLDRHLDIAQSLASVTRNHLAANASVLCVGGEAHGGEHQNK